MIIKQLLWPVVLVGLPDADVVKTITISKLDYTTPSTDCQQTKEKNTIDFNYITNEELIEHNHKKYDSIIP